MTKPTTMRRLPQQVRGEQRIAAILQAAAQVFYEVGFDAATTDMIAQRAHTAIGSLYDFFPNKEAIAQRLSEQFCEDMRVLFEGILTDELVQVPLSQFIDDILDPLDRKSTRLNSSHSQISYAVFCLKKKKASTT